MLRSWLWTVRSSHRSGFPYDWPSKNAPRQPGDGSRRPIVHVYINCHNEEYFMPYFLRHYACFADRIFVYDAFSTDLTRDIVQTCDKAVLIDFDCHEINELRYLGIHNHEYKLRSRGVADWVMCVDADEFVCHPDILGDLQRLLDRGVTLVRPPEWLVVSDEPPTGDGQIWEQVRMGCLNRLQRPKVVAFRPELDINFAAGRHKCNPQPKRFARRARFARFATLHFVYLGEQFCVDKVRKRRARLSDTNREKNWGTQVMVDDQTAAATFWDFRSRAVPIRVGNGLLTRGRSPK